MPENDIGTLYSKINKLDTRVTELESTRPFLKEMIERNIASNEKLSNTLQDVQISMIKMNEKMDDQTESFKQLQKDFEEASKKTDDRIESVKKETFDKIEKVNDKVKEVEEKGKFDIILFIKANWPWIVALLGIGFLYIADKVKY